MDNNDSADNLGGSWGHTPGPQDGGGVSFRPQQMVQHSPQKMTPFTTSHTVAGVLQVLTVIAFGIGVISMFAGGSSDFTFGIVTAAGAVPVFVLSSIWRSVCKIGMNMWD